MEAKLNPLIFREYDIRGVVGQDLTQDTVRLLGRGIGTLLFQEGARSVAIGRDCRESSGPFYRALAQGLQAVGLDTVGIGMVPTPLLYFATHILGVGGGVMVTGSHNPPKFNGFKVCLGTEALHGPQIQAIRQRIEIGLPQAPGRPGRSREEEVRERYLALVHGSLRLERPISVVVDAGNGVGGLVGPEAMRLMGAEVHELYCEPDGRFPHHHPDPLVPENLRALIEEVVRRGAELGVGYDGDGDRLGVVDGTGRIVWADELLIFFSREVLERRPGAPIVFDVKCSSRLMRDIEAHGGRPVMAATGHSLIRARLKREGAPLAGELSGHLFFADEYFGYDDAIYASLRLLRFLSRSPRPFAELVGELPPAVATPEIRVECDDAAKFQVVEELRAHFRERYETVEVDGVRVNFPRGWGLVRASNTQPALVLRFEAEDASSLDAYREEVLGKLREYPAVRFPRD
ncbi:MAG: phosphomannomutase/phosphoglucomutase [Nitrospinota bacterium]